MAFRDRQDAGQQLAERLSEYRNEDALVLALPRGGVVVGYEVAVALHKPLDVVVARKLGAPDRPELGIGAIAPEGARVLDEYIVRTLRITDEYITHIEDQERAEMRRRQRRYRGSEESPHLADRTVLLVDDGLATGATAAAAVLSIRQQNPQTIVLAAPVCSPEARDRLQPYVDEIECLMTPQNFAAVSVWYERFDQTTDEEVVDLMEKARREIER